ncbi:MAG: hypothetical protein U9R08_00390 [Nanoarchaeota archaeon]|nr:hypothetical protein [Nanoarchaeota archaeon]
MAKYIKTSTLRKFYKKEKIAGTKNGIFLADFGDRFCPLVKTVAFSTPQEYKSLEIIAQVENIDMTNVEDFFLQASHFYEQFQRTNSKTLGKHRKYEFRKEHEIIGTVERTLLSGKVYTKDTPPFAIYIIP